MKISIICAVAAVAALVIFIVIGAGIHLRESNPNALLTGFVVIACFALAALIAALITLLIAKLTVVKLKKSGGGEAK